MPSTASNSAIAELASERTQPEALPSADTRLDQILQLSVPVSVILAEQPMPVESILRITAGTILEFDVPFGSELSLVAGNRKLGCGQAVKVGEHFGLRITAIDSLRQRIEAMGAS